MKLNSMQFALCQSLNPLTVKRLPASIVQSLATQITLSQQNKRCRVMGKMMAD